MEVKGEGEGTAASIPSFHSSLSQLSTDPGLCVPGTGILETQKWSPDILKEAISLSVLSTVLLLEEGNETKLMRDMWRWEKLNCYKNWKTTPQYIKNRLDLWTCSLGKCLKTAPASQRSQHRFSMKSEHSSCAHGCGDTAGK